MASQLVSIGAFYLAIFAVGLLAARHGREGTTSGLLLAGRGMPLWVGLCTMTATWVGGGYINGTAEAIYDPAQGLFWTLAPVGYALSLVLGGLFFAPRMRRLNFTTLLDPFAGRYGQPLAAGLFLPALVGEVFWSAAILAALGATVATVLDFALTVSILVSAGIAIAYTMFGGLWSVAYTDVVQLVCILLGLGIALPFAIDAVGGLSVVAETYTARMGRFPRGTDLVSWVDLFLMLMLGGIPWQVYFQRVLAARDEADARRLSLFAAGGCLLLAVPPALLGAIGTAATWPTDARGVADGSLTEPALVLPYVLQYLTPPVVATIGLGAVAAAVMSSVDSSILSGSSMFAWNVYRPLVRPRAGDVELRRVVRLSVLVVGAAATGLALTTRSVAALWILSSDLVYVILFPQLVLVLFWKGTNGTGALAGAVVGLILRLGGGSPELGLPAWLPYPDFLPMRTTAMLASLGTIVIVSLATARRDPPHELRGE